MFKVKDRVAFAWTRDSEEIEQAEYRIPSGWTEDDFATIVRYPNPQTSQEEGEFAFEVEFDRDVGGHAGALTGTPEGELIQGRRWAVEDADIIPVLEEGQRYPLGLKVKVNFAYSDGPEGVRDEEVFTIYDYDEAMGYLVEFDTSRPLGHMGEGTRIRRPRKGQPLYWWVREENIVPPLAEKDDFVSIIEEGLRLVPAAAGLDQTQIGKVIAIDESSNIMNVEFQVMSPHLHDAGGIGAPHRCWNFNRRRGIVNYSSQGPSLRRLSQRRENRSSSPTSIFNLGDRVKIPLFVGLEHLPPEWQEGMEATVVSIGERGIVRVDFETNVGGDGENGSIWVMHQTNLALIDAEELQRRLQDEEKTVRCPRLRAARNLPPL